MPRGPRCELRALQQHHVAPSELREVISDRAADDAAADDHDARLRGKRFAAHGLSFSKVYPPRPARITSKPAKKYTRAAVATAGSEAVRYGYNALER